MGSKFLSSAAIAAVFMFWFSVKPEGLLFCKNGEKFRPANSGEITKDAAKYATKKFCTVVYSFSK